ncbi:hypothetical protein TNCV_1116161 [Trichonephila clavipes]|nr:hypothetical protein TNCV_1116161 [Trichonephila clavipes]
MPQDSTGARDSLTSMSWLLYQLVYNPACLVVPGGAWTGSCIAERKALPRPLLVAEPRVTLPNWSSENHKRNSPPFSNKKKSK